MACRLLRERAKLHHNFGSINSTGQDHGADTSSGSSRVDISDQAELLREDPMTMSGRWSLNAPPTTGEGRRRNLSTFSGVFSPIALSMFSTVLFLRIGFIVGQSGILEAILQFFLAYTILYLTILSLCAVSTNGAIEGGGAYYMISRALGPEFGGSIGFLFFMANIIACGLYISGFVEGLIDNFGTVVNTTTTDDLTLVEGTGVLPDDNRWWSYLYCTGVLFFCLIVCLLGGSMFARTLVFIFAVIIICTGSVIISVFVKRGPIQVPLPPLPNSKNHHPNMTGRNDTTDYGVYTGLSTETFVENLLPHYGIDYKTMTKMSFTTVFAVLFSSVTGIMNGANMSGELKRPSRAIPRGTLAATTFTLLTYLLLSLLLAASCKGELLRRNYGFLQPINLWMPFIAIGTFCVTLSAALGNLIGASRILEALAKDGLFWNVLKPAAWATRGGNPIIAVLISWFLVQLVLLIGSMNTIAPLASVFFLMSYAGINLACLGLELASAPNFRPTFRYFSWHTCLLGLLGCLVMCFLVNAIYASVALLLCLLLVIVLHLQAFPTSWGSISQALIFHQVRKYLLLLDSRKDHVKFWRPQMLLLVANPRSCCDLITFVNDIKKGGLFVLGHVKLGRFDDTSEDPCLKEQSLWQSLIDTLKVKAFAELTLAESIRDGVHHLIRISGLGGMKPNTIMLGFHDNSEPTDYLPLLREQRAARWRLHTTREAREELEQLPQLRCSMDDKMLKVQEYIQLVVDILKMQKNICLCRHFHRLDRKTLFASKKISFIDVWPINFFQPATARFLDNTCLFMLQLACILNMVAGWKSHTQVRVHLCVSGQGEDMARRKATLEQLLAQLRIPGYIEIVSWDYPLSLLSPDPTTDNKDDSPAASNSEDSGVPSGEASPDREWQHQPPLRRDPSQDAGSKISQTFGPENEAFVLAMNRLLVQHSEQCAVTFLYLPRPPTLQPDHEGYLKQLAMLTEGLPPTILVHGLYPVTSTTL